MSIAEHRAAVTEPPAERPDPPAPARPRLRRVLGHLFPAAMTLGCVAGLLALGRATDWKLPRASALRGEDKAETDDWCKEHGVPETECVECRPDLLPRAKAHGWCKTHEVNECPHCHPEVAQLPAGALVTDADRDRVARALSFAPRAENDPKCKKHLRRLQLPSDEMAARLGLAFAPAARGPVEEVVHAPGEIGYDPTRVARVGPRAAGTVWRVERRVGEKVRRGDVLALVEAAEVGRAKAEFQQALVQLDLRRETLAKLRPAAGATVAGKEVQAAEAAVLEAEVRVVAAEELLATLGLPVRAADVGGLTPADLARRVQFLGLPEALAKDLAGRTGSSNLLPVTAPLDGEVVAGTAVKDEATDPARPLFVVADTSRMWLTLRVRPEDAGRVKAGRPVRFRHPGHAGPSGWDSGTVVWVSPAADERTRTVPVRVDLPNPSDRHHANTFGTAEVVLRAEPEAVVVPSGAVHYEGCCHVVFVRDRDYEKPDAPKVVHVRKVRPGATDVPTPAGPVTEVAAGLLPGEWVATANSGVLRSELLKNDLGAG
ncbi:MAG: efflux transporter periplasmic adaptor subunit [Isosphaera sp.]|nr:efflux transporter periplasmic adaptor subunit [Isosphaera sp.]